MNPTNSSISSPVGLTPRQRVHQFWETVEATRDAFQSLRFFQAHPAQSRRTYEGEAGQPEGLLAVRELQATSGKARSMINADLREALEPWMANVMAQAIGWHRDLDAMEGLLAKCWDRDETRLEAHEVANRVWDWNRNLMACVKLMPETAAEVATDGDIKGSPSRPTDDAFRAWQLKTLLGIGKQAEIAARMSSELGRRIAQGAVSRWLAQVERFISAGGAIPSISSRASAAKPIDPAKLDQGVRRDGRRIPAGKRQDDD